MNTTKTLHYVTQVKATSGAPDFDILHELIYYQDNMHDSAVEAITRINR
jgi:hypothetical protein